MTASTDPVDQKLPLRAMLLFGLQHVLVMAASPITAVFLISKALGLSPDLTVGLISATFLACGFGTLLQSFGPGGVGARLPFIMVPGGAPIVIFLTIAQQTDLQTATGAVILRRPRGSAAESESSASAVSISSKPRTQRS